MSEHFHFGIKQHTNELKLQVHLYTLAHVLHVTCIEFHMHKFENLKIIFLA